jgi:hypothetical protein
MTAGVSLSQSQLFDCATNVACVPTNAVSANFLSRESEARSCSICVRKSELKSSM